MISSFLRNYDLVSFLASAKWNHWNAIGKKKSVLKGY